MTLDSDKLLSIIIPVYNPPNDLLKKCIQSILDNSWQNFEVIFIMDYFSENIKNILLSINDNRFHLIENQNRNGVHLNRIKGVIESKGDYIAFIDSDDFIDKDYFISLIEQLELEDADLIFPRYRIFNYLTKKFEETIPDLFIRESPIEGTLNKGFSCTTCLMKKELKFYVDSLKKTCFLNLEDVFQYSTLLKKSKKYIYSKDNYNLYNYVQFNPNSSSVLYKKDESNIKLRILTEFKLSFYFNINIIEDILYLQQNFKYCENLSIEGLRQLNIFIDNNIKNPLNWENQIPKVIHYIWLGKEKEPDIINKWKELNYLIIKWDDTFFKNNTFVQKWIKKGNYSFASDYIRMWVLYNFGGIYLDTDIDIIKPFPEEMFNQPQFFGYEDDDIIIESCCIGACSSNKYIKKFLDWFDNYGDSYGEGFIDIKGNKCKNIMPSIISNILQNEKDISIYPNEILCANHYTEQGKQKYKQTENTILKHYFGGSWLKEEKKIFGLNDFGFK
jgi:glycosyltransferase involved in cell wall biosynthesis